jgi:hypothetical protein
VSVCVGHSTSLTAFQGLACMEESRPAVKTCARLVMSMSLWQSAMHHSCQSRVLVSCFAILGDTRKLLEDCAVLQPTVFCAVPRVYERVYSGVMDKVRDCCDRALFDGICSRPFTCMFGRDMPARGQPGQTSSPAWTQKITTPTACSTTGHCSSLAALLGRQ